MPVFTRVSTATRACGSSLMMASSTASEIWSAILSGWPSDTDSDVKMEYSLIAWVAPWLRGLRSERIVRVHEAARLDLKTIALGQELDLQQSEAGALRPAGQFFFIEAEPLVAAAFPCPGLVVPAQFSDHQHAAAAQPARGGDKTVCRCRQMVQHHVQY